MLAGWGSEQGQPGCSCAVVIGGGLNGTGREGREKSLSA